MLNKSNSIDDVRPVNEEGVRRVAMLAVHSSPLTRLGAKQAGGMNVYVRELAGELGRRGIKVDVYTCAASSNSSTIDELSLNARVITLCGESSLTCAAAYSPAHLSEIVSHIKRFADEQRISYDLIHSHYWLSGLVALELKRWWRVPVVHMFHTLGAMKNLVAQNAAWRETATRLEAEERCLREADSIIAATPLDKEQMHLHYRTEAQTVQAKTTVIPCGVNTKVFRPHDQAQARAQLCLPAAPANLILFVGRIEPVKNLDTLLNALRLLNAARRRSRTSASPVQPSQRDIQLLIIGGNTTACVDRWGDEERRVRQLAGELGLAAEVKFQGAQPHDRLPLFYSAADLLVVPSRYESFGMVALEAQACATPVVASRVGGLTFTVHDRETGFLVRCDDAPAFASRIEQVLLNEKLRRTFGQHARLNAQEFAWAHVANKVVALYGRASRSGTQLRRSASSV